MRFVHLVCLKTWLSRKENIKAQGTAIVSYNWRAYHCELCKGEIDDRVELPDGRVMWILDIQRPLTNYMILESIQLSNNENNNNNLQQPPQ